MKRSDVMEKQIGGQHYKKHLGLQPWDIIDEYGLNYYEGNILKYLLREKSDRIEDLGKMIHYAEKQIERLTKPDGHISETILLHNYCSIILMNNFNYSLVDVFDDGKIIIKNCDGKKIGFDSVDVFELFIDSKPIF